MVVGCRKFVAIAMLAVMLGACHPAARPPAHPVGAPGHWHLVQQGETAGDIARAAGVPVEDLLELNGLRSAAEIQPGKLVFVLELPPPPEAAPPSSPEPAPQSAGALAGAGSGASSARFRWPVDSPRVTSLYGSRWGRQHEGIDLTAPIGTPVLAAGAGEVVYAGNAVRGYGNMIVVKHDGEWMTVYAHNSVLFVRVGDKVNTGQRVALSGQSGHATGPHLHFEVRRGQVPRDPMPYLPDLRPPKTHRERTPKS